MATNKKTISDLMAEVDATYTPKQQAYSDYQGHPWTKMYGDIVPNTRLDSPTLKNLDYYANNFGIDTDVAALQGKFDKLTKQQYAQKNAEYLQSENEYYKNMAAQNAQYQQGVQNAMSQALATGSSRGMQFANQFAAQNELAEQNSTGALDLATQRNNLKAQEAEAYTQNAINAEQTAYDRRANVMQNAIAQNANDTQRYAADATLLANNNALRVNNYQYNMTNELERMFKDRESDDTRWVESLRAMLDSYDYNLRDDQYYAGLENQMAIAQMNNASQERIARTNASNRGSVNGELSYDQMIQAYNNASPGEKAALLASNSGLAAAVEAVAKDAEEAPKNAKKTGTPQSFTDLNGVTYWAMPDGKTLTQDQYNKHTSLQSLPPNTTPTQGGTLGKMLVTPELYQKYGPYIDALLKSPAQNLNLR